MPLDDSAIPQLLELLLNYCWPALLGTVASWAELPAWGHFAQTHSKLSLALNVKKEVWVEFLANAPDSRAKAILREGEISIPRLAPEAIANALTDAGIPRDTALSLAKQGGDAEFVEATVALAKATKPEPATPEENDRARSAAERALFTYLENLPETAGRFEQNAAAEFDFGNRPAEIDLLCREAKIAIEVDGYFHFRDSDGYRRDREKDWELQSRGYLVLRFLAEDVIPEWGDIRDRILIALQGRPQ